VTDDFARNLIGGEWLFPAAPYEYEIRGPRDSAVIAAVPLSSRFDVDRAVAAAHAAAPGWTAEPDERRRVLGRLVTSLGADVETLAGIQARETGLSPADSRATVTALVQWCQQFLGPAPATRGGVGGYVLSWGLPLGEVITAAVPALLAGRAVVLKPSLRAPLSAVAFARLAVAAGLPPGVLNVVQGTGPDVGAALLNTAAGQVRGGERTITAATRTPGPWTALRGGGNVAVAGRAADPDAVAVSVVAALRLHSAGGPLSLPLLAVHRDAADAVLAAVLARVPECRPAPLPAEPLRRRALAYVDDLRAHGGVVRYGGSVPDDIEHRMGWLVPPVVVTMDAPADIPEPVGPVLTVVTWRRPDELAVALTHPRYTDGIACVWAAAGVPLPQTSIVDSGGPGVALAEGRLPSAWSG
jgi:acyl-CoA reductase-like NAD-dependent aldehyde dehydrogenase